MPKKRSNSASGTYEVGYCRPPKQHQFQHGQIGNPAGINKKRARSITPDLKVLLERELRKQIKIRHGKQTLTVPQAAAGISKLVRQYVEGDARARRDLILLCEKFGIDLVNRDALQGALEDALSTEDEAVLADFVKRHGGQYPSPADAALSLPVQDGNLLRPPMEDPKLLTVQPENLTEPRMVQLEKTDE
jgi:Family of unknown function (DUF5681)